MEWNCDRTGDWNRNDTEWESEDWGRERRWWWRRLRGEDDLLLVEYHTYRYPESEGGMRMLRRVKRGVAKWVWSTRRQEPQDFEIGEMMIYNNMQNLVNKPTLCTYIQYIHTSKYTSHMYYL